MAESSSDATLMKVAVFGLAMSLMCTALISVMFVGQNGDYDYDDINLARDELISFSGESMINQTPWKLVAAYTPYVDGDPADHTDPDGWLYGQAVTSSQLPSLGKTSEIRLDPSQKSTRVLGFTEDVATYEVDRGYKWWDSENGTLAGKILNIFTPTQKVLNWMGVSSKYTETVTVNNWDYTGYRYVFDPMLPFSATNEDGDKVGSRDGALSIVWYAFHNGQEGLSGGLDVYGQDVLLASYSAADIVADYRSESGYATTYDFDFQGTNLTLSIRFDPEVIEGGTPLMSAWTQGDWTMAISSLSAGNFFDIEGSTSFTATAGNMIQTFIQIYTFDLPSVESPWMDVILWLLVGLPMTLAMLFITLRLINGFRVI